MDPVAAKQFLISKIVEEAEFEHVALSEVERKMLHFTEVHASLPDILEVNAEFERTCDQDEYELKIASILKNSRSHDQDDPKREQLWKDALAALGKEDHYILVMTGLAFERRATVRRSNRVRDFVIYIGIGIVLVLIVILISVWRSGS